MNYELGCEYSISPSYIAPLPSCVLLSMIVDIQEENKTQSPTSSAHTAVEALTSPLSPPPPAYAHLPPASSPTIHVPPIPGSSLPASVATKSPPLQYGDYPRSQPTLGLVRDLSFASAETPTSIVVNTHPQAQRTQPGAYEMTVRTMTIPPPMPLGLPDTDLVKIGRDYQAFSESHRSGDSP